MVETEAREEQRRPTRPSSGPPRRALGVWLTVPVGGVLAAALAIVLGLSTCWMSGGSSASTRSATVSRHPAQAVGASNASSVAAPLTTNPTATTQPPAPTQTISAPAAAATVAALVVQVESGGIVPGSSWSWSLDDAATPCGIATAADSAVGCTSWSSGVVRTVFTGSPDMALVAHEVANAEVEQFAVPYVLQEVSAAEAGTSWSPTDAVASCLVVHFLGFQDGVAGSWQCPVALATSVALHIHDVVVTTQTTAVCGAASGVSSTLTFSPGSGTLTVTAPSGGPARVTTGSVPVTVSGIGTFTATDVGGTATLTGTCEA